jgi:hypothetical protein
MNGKRVSVWTGNSEDRTAFETSLSVSGTLEQHPSTDQFRIVNDDGNYTYFTPLNVVRIANKKDNAPFKDGSVAVIKISIATDAPFESAAINGEWS